MNIEKMIERALQREPLNKQEAVALLGIRCGSAEFYRLLWAANEASRRQYANKGYIFAQIGLNAQPCSKNCRFCSMAESHYSMDGQWQKDAGKVLDEVRLLVENRVDDLFLMTTADFPQQQFIAIAEKVRRIVPDTVRFVANIGDFGMDTARRLKDTGITGAYHVRRLREGVDTGITPEERMGTLHAIKDAGLDLYYCVEPIGPEHDHGEMADEMLRARELGVDVMAVMRRIPVRGTPLFNAGQISAMELTKIEAVTRLVTLPSRAMNAHEVTPMTLLAGVNQLYAEYGSNPRDSRSNTQEGRGYSVDAVRALLADAEYDV